MKFKTLFTIFLISKTLSSYAEIMTDSTLGQGLELSGPNYKIGAELGQQHGSNLFHSFRDFNLQSHESATFSGPNNVNNVISRVTGGNPSTIDGTLRLSIPNADMYFLNPYGIMFGPNAKLDVPGSFHASTADYLRLSDGGQFNARQPNNSLLTIAPIEAFGFVTDNPAIITVQDSHLSVPAGEHFSLIGGDLRLNGSLPVRFDELGSMAVFGSSQLSAQVGRVNLASVASQGEVVPHPFGLDLNAKGGKIKADKTLIDVSGPGSGSIFIRGGQFVMQDAAIQANTFADMGGQVIDLTTTESVQISGDLLAILSKTFGNGNAGHIFIMTPHLEINGSIVNGASIGTGSSGNIHVAAKQVLLKNGGALYSTLAGNGLGGNIEITATETLSLSGRHTGNILTDGFLLQSYPSIISTAMVGTNQSGNILITTNHLDMIDGVVAADTFSSGNAGNITVNANTASLQAGASITSNTFSEGKGGNVNVKVTDTITLAGRRAGKIISPIGFVVEHAQSYFGSMAFSNGDAGNIAVSASTLHLDKEAVISTLTVGNGDAGNVTVEVTDLQITRGGAIGTSNSGQVGEQVITGDGQSGTLHITATDSITISAPKQSVPSSLTSMTASQSSGGDIFVVADKLILSENGQISANSDSTGNAGQITLQANTINIADESHVSTAAQDASGGNIIVKTPNLLYLRDGQITTSVGTGKGHGGDIRIENPLLVVLDKGQIKAQADEGQGGDINVTSNRFIASKDSVVSASSRLGIDGQINIDSPEVNLEEFLVVLPGGFVEASLTHCDIQDIENPSRFKINQPQDSLPFARKHSNNAH